MATVINAQAIEYISLYSKDHFETFRFMIQTETDPDGDKKEEREKARENVQSFHFNDQTCECTVSA